MSRLDSLAIAILQGLMLRHNEAGYTDEGAIHEAYRLAEETVIAKPQTKSSNIGYSICQGCGEKIDSPFCANCGFVHYG